MNLSAISRNVGYALLVSALFMLLSIGVSVAGGNDSALAALIISFTITFIVGIFPFIFVRKATSITLKEGYLTITLSWLLSFVFGMLPYALWGGPFTIVNAWFESVSGFTTTGGTILDNVEALPRSLLFWRSSTHFIGGLGIVVFLLLVIPDSSPVRMRLTGMELSSLSKGAYRARSGKTVNIFALVYIAIAVVAFLGYMLAGMGPFDAVCHAMSVCAAGGFSTRNLSIAAFDSPMIELLTVVFMLLASVHFGLLYLAVVRRSLKPLRNPVLKFYLITVAVFSVVVGLSLKFSGRISDLGEALWNGVFHVVSYVSTTGFAISDNSGWPLMTNVAIMILCLMCGCAGSTTGGIKADRVLVLLKSIGRNIGRILHPSAVNEVRLGSTILKDGDVYPHLLYIAVYVILLVVSVLLASMFGMDGSDCVAVSVSSLGNVGPSVGEFGAMGSYNGISSAAKMLFTMDMFLGRVEIYPILAVVAMMFDKSRN